MFLLGGRVGRDLASGPGIPQHLRLCVNDKGTLRANEWPEVPLVDCSGMASFPEGRLGGAHPGRGAVLRSPVQ